MDYNKLAKIADGWGNPSCKRSATVPKSAPKEGSVLDRMEVRSKISDSEQQKSSVKVMILDDVQINKIMSAPRDEKRKVLSRLSDSQRRRVLARYRELQKVKDDESVNRLNLVTLDTLLSNCVISCDDYNKNLIEQWKSAYEVPSEIADFVEAVVSDDKDGISSGIDAYKEFMEGNDIKSMIDVPQNDGLSEDMGEAPIDTPIDEPMAEGDDMAPIDEPTEEPMAESDEITELPEDTEDVEDMDMTEDIPDLKDIDDEIGDSIKTVAVFDCLKYMAGAKGGVLKVADASIMALATKYGCDYDAVAAIYDAAWSAKMSETRQSIVDSAKAMETKLTARRVMDAVIDEIADKPLISDDGEEVKGVDDKPILEALSEALEAYVNGDASLLEEIANLDTAGNKINEDDMTPEEAELSEENKMLKDELEEAKEDDKVSESAEEHDVEADKEEAEKEKEGEITDSKDDCKECKEKCEECKECEEECEEEPFHTTESDVEVECPVKKLEEAAKEEEKDDKALAKELAQLLKCIEKGESYGEIKDSINGLIDSLRPKVKALQKYNFKVNDCNYPFYSQVAQPASVMNIPMDRSEYYAMCPVVPECFDLVCANYSGAQQCPECNEYEVMENGLCVNPTTNPQSYYPVNCTLQEIADLLKDAQPEEYTTIVNDHCIPMSDAFKVAALTNSLSFIDNTFYKKHVGDAAWCFDVVPACLNGIAKKAGSIKLVTKKTDSSVELWGQNFEIL